MFVPLPAPYATMVEPFRPSIEHGVALFEPNESWILLNLRGGNTDPMLPRLCSVLVLLVSRNPSLFISLSHNPLVGTYKREFP